MTPNQRKVVEIIGCHGGEAEFTEFFELCRRAGINAARRTVNRLLDDGIFTTVLRPHRLEDRMVYSFKLEKEKLCPNSPSP